MSFILNASQCQVRNLFKKSMMVQQIQIPKNFSKGLLNSARFTNHRRIHGNKKRHLPPGRVLLDTFVKQAFWEGTVVVRAPFCIQVHISSTKYFAFNKQNFKSATHLHMYTY